MSRGLLCLSAGVMKIDGHFWVLSHLNIAVDQESFDAARMGHGL
jgi:hypothetical protein